MPPSASTRRCCSTSSCCVRAIPRGIATRASPSACACWRCCACSSRPRRRRRPASRRRRACDRRRRRRRRCRRERGEPHDPLGRPRPHRRRAARGRRAGARLRPDAADRGDGPAVARGARRRPAQPRTLAEDDAGRAPACARPLSRVAAAQPRAAAERAPELQALPGAAATGKAAHPPGPVALERAARGAPAGVAAGVRPLPAPAPRAARAHHAALPAIPAAAARGARARHAQLGALAEDVARGARAGARAGPPATATAAPAAAAGTTAAAPAAAAAPARRAAGAGGAMRQRLATAVLVAACLAASLAPRAQATGPVPAADDAAIVHALSRLGFGPRPGDVERVKAIGLAAWIEGQLEPRRLDDRAAAQALAALPTLTMSTAELHREYPRPDLRQKSADPQMAPRELFDRPPPEKRPVRIVAEMQAARMVRAIESERQLEEVMVDFWFNHFNVHAAKGEVKWYLTSYERAVIRPHALGKFGDLLRGTATHPAMLFYLDNWLSTRPNFTVPFGANRGKRAGLNENYARELMELHTLGVDGGYTQTDVTEVARAFTGWTIDRPQTDGHFIFRPAMHDPGEKVVLGQRIPAGGGRDDGERVIEILTRHPATARFVATKLVRRFVSDTPPPALVARVAGTYTSTGGDISAMLRTIVESPEFFSEDAYRAKIKKPFEFVASAVRALGGGIGAQSGITLARASAEIGEPLYQAQPPTGYADRGEAWVNAGALLARMNFALGLASGRYPSVSVELPALVAGADPSAPAAMLDRLLASIVTGQAGPQTRAVLTAQLSEPQITRLSPDDRGRANTDVAKLAALVIGSPEFQRR